MRIGRLLHHHPRHRKLVAGYRQSRMNHRAAQEVGERFKLIRLELLHKSQGQKSLRQTRLVYSQTQSQDMRISYLFPTMSEAVWGRLSREFLSSGLEGMKCLLNQNPTTQILSSNLPLLFPRILMVKSWVLEHISALCKRLGHL